MSLSTFFKDYVYIPLGGNRTSKVRNIINILIVWTITGLWHGASWNFVLWGFYYGVLLIIEKFFLKKYLDKMPSIINHIYAIIFILLGWLIFASVDLTMLSNFLKSLCGFNGIYNHTTIFYATSYFVPLLIASIISTPIYLKYKEWVNKQKYEFVFYIIESIIIIILFITTIALLVSDTYNPFLYFRF